MEQKTALKRQGGSTNREEEQKDAPQRPRRRDEQQAESGRTLKDMYQIVFERLSR